MTAAFLQSELASLIQDSKRRQSDVKTTAEKSLADLKAIQVTSETQLAGDLLRRPQFIEPFILACSSKYVKLAFSGVVCLQRLVASRAIAPSRLADTLDAFQQATQQGLDSQLKVLQALPSLLQLYAAELHGQALAKTLSLCAGLAANKNALVSGTAIATFQELISTLLDKQAQGSTDNDDLDDSEDIANVFNDMCKVTRGETPEFLKPQGLTLPLALEVLELALSNETFAILSTPSCAISCETFLVPGIGQILEKTTNFSAFGRSLRILYLLVTRELDRMIDVLSDPFIIVLNIMDRPSGPPWRRIMCLEFMRSMISDFQLLKTIYGIFDGDDEKKNVIGSLMSILVRIAAEDPALIGLGRQSTIPTNIDNETVTTGGAHVDVDAVGSVLQASSNVTGISSKWSTRSNPLLEQLEKQTAPDIPETYIYTLVLGCVAALSDGLSKYLMPLSVPSRAFLETADTDDADGLPQRKNSQVRRAEKYQRLLNPLKRDDLPNKEEIQICAKLIEDCWPAVLATCSTFLNSALDSHFYHILVRTVQKLAQVSGVLELFTPRDALLTTLAKVSVPVNASSIVTMLHGNKLARTTIEEDDQETEEASIKSPIPTTPRLSVDISKQPLNVRNLLCLRALLNLGIALGPTLSQASWFIIIQALQQTDALMSVSPAARNAASKPPNQEEADFGGQASLGSEITAVGTASKRMLESTRTYSDETLEIFIRSVLKMIDTLIPETSPSNMQSDTNGKQELRVNAPRHRASRSVSGVSMTAAVLQIEVEFVLKTISDLARVNLHRFCSSSSQKYTWDLIVAKLVSIVADHQLNPQLRLQAANVLDAIATETARFLDKTDEDDGSSRLQALCLGTLAKQLSLLYKKGDVQSVLVTDIDIHRRLLEALENIVSNSGDSLDSGWKIIFEILQKTTRQTSDNTQPSASMLQEVDAEIILERTIPSAFRTVQLIVSDFLTTIDPQSFSILAQLLPSFGTQKNDLNISLTTTVLFSNLSTLLLERTESIDLQLLINTSVNSQVDPLVTAGRTATDVSSLWFAIVLQLCLLCKDDRSDVRNSALRVLVRVLESASSQMTSNAWNVSLQEALLPILEEYSSKQQDISAWHTSYSQLLEGMTNLFVQNTEVIIASEGFETTWAVLVQKFETKLAEKTLEGHTAIFSTMAELLRALPPVRIQEEGFIAPVLRCWSENNPADIPIDEIPNQDALYAHALLFEAVTMKAHNIVQNFSMNGRNLVELAMSASKQAVLASIHPPYSSDITKLSSEQSALADNLRIIKKLMESEKKMYSMFLLDLIASILLRNTATDVENQTIGTGSKKFKRPTLVAFMRRCIEIFREKTQEESTNTTFTTNIPIENAMQALTKVAATKYTNIPTNNDLPAWKDATSGIVELIEAIQKNMTTLLSNDLKALSEPVVLALEKLLTAPELARKIPAPSPEIVISDEAFDIAHFIRFHNASIPLLRHVNFQPQLRKQYVLTLFHSSLIAKPWFGDMPPDLLDKPLANFKEIRPGTIRPPDFLLRTKIPYEALSVLLQFVSKETDSPPENFLTTSKTAAPYVLLRLAHSIKVFIADQRLRNLIPPPKQSLHELSTILTKALQLRVHDEAFETLLPNNSATDGRSHLRILFPLVIRLKEFWAKLPRLKVCAWQDSEDGKAVEKALDGWGEALAEAWVVDFE